MYGKSFFLSCNTIPTLLRKTEAFVYYFFLDMAGGVMAMMIFVWFYTFAKVWNTLTDEITLQISLKSHLKI